MSNMDPPPSSELRVRRAPASARTLPSGQREAGAFAWGGDHGRIDAETVRSIYQRVRTLVPEVPLEDADGYRLLAIAERCITTLDIRLAGHGCAVLGSRAGCDLVLSNDAGVLRRHLAVIAVRLDDGSLGARIVDLKTELPFFLDDDTPRQSALARGRFAMRVGRHVVCGFPIVLREDAPGGPPPQQEVSSWPRHHREPAAHQGSIRVLLERGPVGASVEVPNSSLGEGVILGRSLACFDPAARRVLEHGAISAEQLLLLRCGGDLFAFDLCSANGTRVKGARVRRHRLTPGAPTLVLGKAVTVTVTGLEGER